MAKTKLEMKKPTTNDYKRIVMAIQETLWPGGDADFEWSADTVQEIAAIMERCGFGPKEDKDSFTCKLCGEDVDWADRSEHALNCEGETTEEDSDDDNE